MDFEEEDRSSLLQRGAYYQNHHQNQHTTIAYDNLTANMDQIERDECSSRQSVAATSLDKPTSPPPSYEHVLNEPPTAQNRLYVQQEGASSSSSCQFHSPRIDSDDGTQTTQLSESDSESQCMHCECQLLPATSTAEPSAVTSAADTETITLNEIDAFRENADMFAAWQHSTGNGNEIEISNKSSKQLYKLINANGGCKMSSECRCDECQSNYFDCEFDNNENQKTDGGLGAGTPMFINEVMHGAACNIL